MEQHLLALLQEAAQVIQMLMAEVQEARSTSSGQPQKADGQQKTASDMRALADAFGISFARMPETVKTAAISPEDARRVRTMILAESSNGSLGKTASVMGDEPCYTDPAARLEAQMAELLSR